MFIADCTTDMNLSTLHNIPSCWLDMKLIMTLLVLIELNFRLNASIDNDYVINSKFNPYRISFQSSELIVIDI